MVFDYHPEVDDQREAFEAARARLADTPVIVETLADVLDRGKALPAAPLAVPSADADDPLALLIYTSGSTGAPKGAMYPRAWSPTSGAGPAGDWDEAERRRRSRSTSCR